MGDVTKAGHRTEKRESPQSGKGRWDEKRRKPVGVQLRQGFLFHHRLCIGYRVGRVRAALPGSRALGRLRLGVGSIPLLRLGQSSPKVRLSVGVVGGELVLVELFVERGTDFGLIPATQAVMATLWTICGLVMGAVLLAGGRDRPLPK